MFLRFLGPTDLESWARDYRLEVTATDDGLVVTGDQWAHLPTHGRSTGGDDNRPLGFVQTQTDTTGCVVVHPEPDAKRLRSF